MVNVIPPDHVDDVPVVEPNQHDDFLVVPEPVLVDEDKDPKEEEFKEEEEPQEGDDMEVDIKKDENEPELTYPYEDWILLTLHRLLLSQTPRMESSIAPFIREDSDGLLLGLIRRDINSLFGRMDSLSRRLYGRETTHALVEKKGKAKDGYYGKLILELGNKVCFSAEQGMATMEKLVERLGNVEEKAECKKLKKELEEARFSNTFLRMQNERGKKVKFSATILQGPTLTWWNAKVATMGWETNNQKQGNARVMVTAPTDGKVSSRSLYLYEHCFTRHVGPCTIKCQNCRKVGHKARTFNVIIGMDWLVKHDVVIVCGDKVVHIPYGDKMLIVKSEKGVARLKVIACIKSRKYVERGLPPLRQVEFQIDLVPRVTPVARAPHRLTPPEIRELSHLKIILELLNKERLYAMFSKCKFWPDSVQVLGHVIDHSVVYVDLAKIEAIKN
nr:hypothetical protein [Tanacetum cinerariifolium]